MTYEMVPVHWWPVGGEAIHTQSVWWYAIDDADVGIVADSVATCREDDEMEPTAASSR